MDPQLVLFHRQYLQLVEPDFLTWPPQQLLRAPDVQTWLYRRLFDPERNARLPPARYQLRVVKPLLAKVEAAIEDPEEDVSMILQVKYNYNLRYYFRPSHLSAALSDGFRVGRRFRMSSCHTSPHSFLPSSLQKLLPYSRKHT